MQFLAYFFFFLTVIGSTFGATGEKFIKNTLQRQERNEKKCKSLYPKSVNTISKITPSNRKESIKYFDCTIDYAVLLMIVNPRTLAEEEVNRVLDKKIAVYEEMIFRLEAKNNNTDSSVLNSEEEIITEKQFIIKKSEDRVISVPEKIETLDQARRKCEKKGFKEKSFDSLELYLFANCIKEEGFTYKRPESVQKVLNAKQDEERKEKFAKKIREKQDKDEVKRKKELAKKVEKEKRQDNDPLTLKQKTEIQEIKTEVQEVKIQPDKLEPVKTKVELVKQPEEEVVKQQPEPIKQPEVSKNPTEPEINAIPEEEIVIKTEMKPSEINKNVTYTRKTACKIDVNGSKICIYEPTYKVQGTTPINKL